MLDTKLIEAKTFAPAPPTFAVGKYRLAAALAKTHPEASARLVKRPLDKILPETGDKFYEKTVKTLKLYRQYLTAAGKPEKFQKECFTIREQYKRRKKFIAMLNRARL